MKPIDVRFALDPADPKSNVVEVAGVNVASACQSLTFTADSLRPRLRLDLFINQATHHGPAFVDVPEKTHAALVAIGWTPPPTDEAARAHELAALLLANPIYRQLAEQAQERGLVLGKADIALDEQRQFERDELRVRLTVDLVPAARPADEVPAGQSS